MEPWVQILPRHRQEEEEECGVEGCHIQRVEEEVTAAGGRRIQWVEEEVTAAGGCRIQWVVEEEVDEIEATERSLQSSHSQFTQTLVRNS